VRKLIPNSTQVPDVILDQWMSELSGAEFKVVMYVARRTYGFGRDSDDISINQICRGIRRRDGTRLDQGTGLSRSGVKAACNSLIGKGVLLRSGNVAQDGREREESTYRLNLYAPVTSEPVGRKKAYPGRKVTEVGRKAAAGRPTIGRQVGQKLALQETGIQETEQETAAAKPQADEAGRWAGAADADLLFKELISQGVGRSTACRLSRHKPEMCRLALEYLPYAQVKSSPGAWLANAIEQEWGPPAGWLRAKGQQGNVKGGPIPAPSKTSVGAGDIGRQRPSKMAKLRDTYARLEKARGEALRRFNEYLDQEHLRATRMAELLSPARKEEHLRALNDPERRLEIFGQWIRGEGKVFSRHLEPSLDIQGNGGQDSVPQLDSKQEPFEAALLRERAGEGTSRGAGVYP
jgi:hypothetical protein